MSFTACTIQPILSTDNPNEGRTKINNSLSCLQNTISSMQIMANTGSTIVSESTNISVALSYSGLIPVYSVAVINDPSFNSLSSTSLNISNPGSGTSITSLGLDISGNVVSGATGSFVNYWTSGSSGLNSIRAVNDTPIESNGDYSVAEGNGTLAKGNASHAEGNSTISDGESSHAEGSSTRSMGDSSHSEGYNNTSRGDYSHAEGSKTLAFGTSSHAEGSSTRSMGDSSHSQGYYTTAIGSYSDANGYSSISIGNASHAEGSSTTSIGGGSHSEGVYTISEGIASHAGGQFSVATGNTSFIHSTNSFAFGDRSVVLGGENLTGSSNDTVYVPYLNVKNLYSGTSAFSLGVDSLGNIVTASTANLGRILFVSTTGNDSTGEIGNINKPWRNIYSAKSASTSGDTVYVLPGTWVYDNRNSAGNPYNGQIDSLVNLWKNGITYYFSPGSKIIFYNQTVSGQAMYLFGPTNTSGETCTVLGGLEWVGNSTGADSSNGHSIFFSAEANNDSGFTFNGEVKKLSSFSSEIYRINRGVTLSSDTNVANFRLIADEFYHEYVSGQSGSGSMEQIAGSDAVLNVFVNVRERIKSTAYHVFQITGNFTRSNINIFGDKLIHSGNYTTIFLRSFTGVVNMDIKKMYWYNIFLQTQVSGGGTFNLNGDLNDYYKNNSSTGGVFYLTVANNTINYKGNITTNTGAGVGRYIAATTQPNTININGDIQYIGTATTTQFIFQTINASTVNYSGKILGTYGGSIAQTYTGTININNSFIKSTIDSSSSKVFINGTTSQGNFRLNNSYVEMVNGTSAISNGSYVKAMINNSTIINSGSANTLSNTTDFGTLQVVNSSVISSYTGATSIYNTGATFVVSSNSVVNTNYNITDIRGSLTVLSDLIY